MLFNISTPIIIGILVFAVLANKLTKYFNIEKWQTSVGLVGLSFLLYLLSNILTQYFIKKRTPEYASFQDIFPNVQKWEITAGIGIVPKWVSIVGLLSISAFFCAIMPFIVEFIKRLF